MNIVSIADRALVRLIPVTYHKPPVLRGVVDSDEEAELLAELEGETSARLVAEKQGSPALDRRELAFARRSADLRLYGQAHVNAAFVYTRTGGSRFNPEGRGAWYCSYEALTSIQEVGFHRTRELAYIGVYEDQVRYVEILADFIGDFPSLEGVSEHPALNPSPSSGYAAGQALAYKLRQDGHRGLLYPSVRHTEGRCFVAFDPAVVQNVRPGATWELSWRGSADFVTRYCERQQ